MEDPFDLDISQCYDKNQCCYMKIVQIGPAVGP